MEASFYDFLLSERFEALLAISISFIALFVPPWQTIRERQLEIASSRYFTVISPLFELIEPYMMRSTKCNALDTEAIHAILKDHPQLCGGNLLRFRYMDLNSSESASLCRIVSREYDRLCRQLGIPLRTQIYRVNAYQPRFCVFDLIVVFIRYTAISIFSLLLMAFTALSSVKIVDEYHPFSLIILLFSYITILSIIKQRKS